MSGPGKINGGRINGRPLKRPPRISAPAIAPIDTQTRRQAALVVVRWAQRTWPDSRSRQIIEARLMLDTLGLRT